MIASKSLLTLVITAPLSLLLGCSPDEKPVDDHGHGDEEHGHDEGADSDSGTPEAMGRDEEDADPHEHGDDEVGHVELTETQFQSADIAVVQALPGQVKETLSLPGTVAPNADAVIHVTPRVAGQVRQVLKRLGERVEAGELLCVIDSVELGDAAADCLRDKAMVAAAQETLEREEGLFEKRVAALTTVLDGSIEVHDRIYQREDELQQKAVSTIRPLLEADKALQEAKLDRERQLTELHAERDARLLALDVDLRSKRIDLAAARNRLLTLGIPADDIDGISEGAALLAGEYRVYSAGTGVAVDRHISPGEFVEAGSRLFVIEDLSRVWFVASAFEEQLQTVRTGQSASVSLDAFAGSEFSGSVSLVEFRVDPTSRSVGVRIALDNDQLETWPEELPLRPGMFGRVELETASRMAGLVLPEKALVHEDDGDYVFVQVEPLAFERRSVITRAVAGDKVEVLQGLEEGETVAVSGTFLLKSAERASELGGGHSH